MLAADKRGMTLKTAMFEFPTQLHKKIRVFPRSSAAESVMVQQHKKPPGRHDASRAVMNVRAFPLTGP
jgi:hypothetical protein